ncbi:MAG: hypothetical protein H6R04_1732 [Burkholderiaceae bacterium]|nr:hypothetical protein [Burkholderiaceae bacterium]
MLILKCTKKVQAYLGLTASDLLPDSAISREAVLGAWYVNQFRIGRRSAFIFMSERTLLSFILFDVKKSNSKKALFPEICLAGIVQLLKFLQTPLPLIGKVIEDSFNTGYANTDSRSALGNLNDLAFLYQHFVMAEGGLEHCNLTEIILRVNRTPRRNLGGSNSTDITREMLGG